MKKAFLLFAGGLCGAVALLTVLLISFGCSQQKEKIYRVGFINPNPLEKEGAQGFLDNMPKLGYVAGKNLTYIKCEERDKKRIESAIKDMVAKKVDLIFSITTTATQLAKKHTDGTDIPVVCVLYDAIKTGYISSLKSAGGNLAGVQIVGSTAKSLEWMRTIVPHADHILVPICFDTGAAKHSLDDLLEAAKKIDMKVTVAEVNSAEGLSTKLASMPSDIDAVFILHSWLVGSHVQLIIDELKDRNILLFSAGHVDYAGGVAMSYAPSDHHTGMQAARLAHSMLQGAPPPALPVETAEFFLGVNLKTAKKLGVAIPEDVLRLADFVIR